MSRQQGQDVSGAHDAGNITVGVVGAGAWGTALALSAVRAGHEVILWVREPELAETMRRKRENVRYLPGVELPAAIAPTAALEDLRDCSLLLLVTPAQATRAMLRQMQAAGLLAPQRRLLLCAKGLEQGTRALLSEVVHQEAAQITPLVLSGPSFAAEVARNLPAAVTLAAADIAEAREVARMLAHRRFRIYSSDDLVGVQLGGALKNVLAIACGVVEGMGLGHSARAALLTRAFAEMRRLGRVMGAREETLSGLSGLGDLMLTATSSQSRNYSLGVALGQGRSVQEVLGERITVAEGVFTAEVVAELAQEHGIDMPVAGSVQRIVCGRSDAATELQRLLARPLRDETDAPTGQAAS